MCRPPGVERVAFDGRNQGNQGSGAKLLQLQSDSNSSHNLQEDRMSPRRQSVRTRKDAMEHVDMAVDFYKAAGREIAFAEFTNPEGQFVDGEMYIYVLGPKGTMLAHGANEGFVGEEWIAVKDSGGKPFVKEIARAPRRKATVGWNTNGTTWK